MARAISAQRKLITTIAAWAVALIIFFPVFWMILTSFKTEASAVAMPPEFLSADWTLDNYAEVWARSDYPRFFWNSVVISVGSTLLGLVIAVPAAWAMAFVPGRKTKDLLMWMLSTKMMPAVAVMIPLYLLFLKLGLIDTKIGLVIALMLMNLPIIVWMLYTYFKEIPGEILEAARMDGAGLWSEIVHVLTPMALPGHRLDLPAEHHPGLERGVLDHRPDHHQGGPPDGLHRQLFGTAGPVLRETLGGIGHGHPADPDPWLVQPEATRPRPDLWRGEVRTHGQDQLTSRSASRSARWTSFPAST
jgi:sorbitol/mannitol transport system permease protein